MRRRHPETNGGRAVNYENVTTRTVKDMLRDPICPEDFGVPEQHAKAAQNYANYMLAQVTAERDALREDAERYRFIRSQSSCAEVMFDGVSTGLAGKHLDAAIDEARGKT